MTTTQPQQGRSDGAERAAPPRPLPIPDNKGLSAPFWEGAKRQVARLRGLPRPAPADVARMMPLAYGVFAVLAVMGVLLIYADLVVPVTLR